MLCFWTTSNQKSRKFPGKSERFPEKWIHNITDSNNLSNHEKIFLVAVALILLYWSPTWTQSKHTEKMFEGNYTLMLQAVLNKSWKQHPTKRQLCGNLPPISKTIQVRRTRHAGHCWKTKEMSRVFANGLGDRNSISGRVIPKTQKWYLMPPWQAFSIIS